jgi:hypothetical protein
MIYVDTLISGASLCGIISAAAESKNRRKVLLINQYGFPGGSITESLNLYQKIDKFLLEESDLMKKIFTSIQSSKYGLLLNESNRVVVNPETLKYVLQKELEKFNVDVLFHVQPRKVVFVENDNYEIFLTGREGEIKVKASKIIDASENHQISIQTGRKRTLLKSRLNFIANKIKGGPVEFIDRKYDMVQLEDGRLWIAVNIDIKNEEFIEIASHERTNEFSEILRRCNSRIQILPAQTQMIYSIEEQKGKLPNCFTVDDMLDRKYESHEEIKKAVDFEKLLKHG